MRIYLIFLLIVTFLAGCDRKGGTTPETTHVISNKSIDMSEGAIAKRWFKGMFNNSYGVVSSISGECVSWGRDGTCSYSITLEPTVKLNPVNTFQTVPCGEIYSGFLRFFKSASVKPEDISCFVCEEVGSNQYIASLINSNTHYIWETYVIE